MPHGDGPVQNVPNRLVSNLFSQKESGKYCDVALRFGEVELRAHACVVASYSPVFDNLVSSGEVMPCVPGKEFHVQLVTDPQFSCLTCVTKVVDFMYLGKIQVEDDHLEHIKVVSQALQVSELLKICRKHSDKSSCRAKSGHESMPSPLPSSLSARENESKSLDLGYSLQSSVIQEQESSKKLSSCDMPVDSSLADDIMDEGEWGGLKCPKCDLVFMSLAKYQQHCSSHLGKTFTSCFVCNYASIRVPDVIKHLLEKDHGEKVCSICLLEVNSSQNLKDHIQIHDQAQPFFCLTCNTRFQTRTALNSHIVRHLNETPFVCKECGRGFKWKHGLRSHMVTHSKLKAFLCDQCGYSTAHLRSFIDHKTVHSGAKFKCPKPDCKFSSVRKESVKHHLKTHSKQRPFQCEICGQAFSQCKNLRRHAASHNPLADTEKCPLCSYQTNRSDKFKSHFKRYHKNGEGVDSTQRKRRKSSLSSSTPVDNLEDITDSKDQKETISNNDEKREVPFQLSTNSPEISDVYSQKMVVDEESFFKMDTCLPHQSKKKVNGEGIKSTMKTDLNSPERPNEQHREVCLLECQESSEDLMLFEKTECNPYPSYGNGNGDHGTAAENVIILDAETVLSAPPDTVYVIPDGTVLIVDANLPD